MITRFKIFETINEMPKSGDYIYSTKYGYGQILNKVGNGYYTNWANTNDGGYIGLDGAQYWSNDREELETFINAKKYNI